MWHGRAARQKQLSAGAQSSDEPPATAGTTDAVSEGRDACRRDPDRLDCHNPYCEGTPAYAQWERGFAEAKDQGDAKPGESPPAIR